MRKTFSIFSISLFVLTIPLIFLLIPLTSAQCFDVQLSKQTYFSGELFQAEISGQLEKALTLDDLKFFYNDKEYFPAFDFEQIASDKWLVWTNVPKNYGQNKITVKGLCKEEILKDETVESNYLIQKPLQETYNWLVSQVENQWPSLTNEETTLVLEALSYDKEISEEGTSELISKSSNQECWPLAECEVKPTALALTSLKDSQYTEKIKTWMLDAENNIDIGLWDLIATSDILQTCTLTINGENQTLSLSTGTNSPFALTLPDDPEITITLSPNCSLSSAKVSHTYLGSVNNFPIYDNTLTLNNKKCWGQTYRSECTAEATAYAILAMQELGESSLQEEISWLSENLDTTTQRAIYHSLTNDPATEEWLINNQAPTGYWAATALAISNTPDITSTVFATKTLANSEKLKGESWLKSQLEETGHFPTIKDTVLALQIFSSDKIEPLVSSPGLMKVKSNENFSIKFSNNGILDVNLTASLFGAVQKTNIPAFSSREVQFTAQQSSELKFEYVEISYTTSISEAERSFKLPVVIFPSRFTETEHEGLLTDTPSGEVTLFPEELKFDQEKLEITMQKDTTKSFIVTLTSLSEATATITVFGLSDVLDGIEPSNFDLIPGQVVSLNITFDTTNAFGSYSGSINVETAGTSITLPVSLSIGEPGEVITEEEAEEEKEPFKINTKLLGWGILIIAVLTAAAFIYLKLKKKPKAPLKIALEKVGLQKLGR